MTIQELFDRAGGAWKLAGEIGVHQWTIERWKKSGIPFKHWETLEKKYKVSANDLAEMSRKAKGKKK